MLELNITGVPNEIEKIVLESKYIYIVKFNFPSGVKTIWVDFSNQRGIVYENPNPSEAVPIGRFHESPPIFLPDLVLKFSTTNSCCTRTHNLSRLYLWRRS